MTKIVVTLKGRIDSLHTDISLRLMMWARPPAARLLLKSQALRLCASVRNRKAWLFAGSELAGQRAAIVMSLV